MFIIWRILNAGVISRHNVVNESSISCAKFVAALALNSFSCANSTLLLRPEFDSDTS
jgi:hypothetical protein